MRKIEIYGREGCRYCKEAVRFCENMRIPFVYRDIRMDENSKREMFERNPEAKTVPQIFVGDRLIGGFNDLETLTPHEIQQLIGE